MCWSVHICRTTRNGRILHKWVSIMPTDWRTIPQSLCATLSLLFHFLFLFFINLPCLFDDSRAVQRNAVPAALNCFSLFRSDTLSRLSCIFIRGASLHSPLFGRYTSLLPFVSPIPEPPRSSTSVIVIEAHWTLSLQCRLSRALSTHQPSTVVAAFANATHAVVPRTYLRAYAACAFRMRTQSTAAYSLTHPRCFDRSALIRISICIERIGMLMYYSCRCC